jgi:hypothetical protein
MVPNAIASRVRQALYAIATLFVVHPTPAEMDYILPLADLQMHVGQWATLALIPGQSRDIAKNTTVTSATHYKSRTGKTHEKLLIALKTPRVGASPGKITYIVTDRGSHTDDRDNNGRKNSSLSPTPASSSSNISVPSPDVRANDRIFVPGTRAPSLDRYQRDLNIEYITLGTVTLTTPMSLAELAILLNTVNDHSIHNDLCTYERYWYPYTVWEVLRTQFRGNVKENEMQDRRGIYTGVAIRREDSVEKIADEYRSAWKSFCEAGTRTRQEEEATIREVHFESYGCMEYSLTICN